MEDTRPVIDFYKYWSVDAIRADLDTKRHNFSILITNEFNDFNVGTVIRNSNAFLAKEVIIYGRRKWDRRGAVGTHLYQHLKYVKYVDELDFSNSIVIGIDNIPGAEPMEEFIWPKEHFVMVFGQEQVGITDDIKALCNKFIYIKQYGSTRSLNVGCASAIAMYDFCAKLAK